MKQKIKLVGNGETVGYALDAIKNKAIRFPIGEPSEHFLVNDYEIKTISLNSDKKDPYRMVAVVKLKIDLAHLALLRTALHKLYSTLEVE